MTSPSWSHVTPEYISDPSGRAESVHLADSGMALSKELAKAQF
jgi:hypothetical protein